MVSDYNLVSCGGLPPGECVLIIWIFLKSHQWWFPKSNYQASIQGLPPCILDSTRWSRSMSVCKNATRVNMSAIKQKPVPTQWGLGHVGQIPPDAHWPSLLWPCPFQRVENLCWGWYSIDSPFLGKNQEPSPLSCVWSPLRLSLSLTRPHISTYRKQLGKLQSKIHEFWWCNSISILWALSLSKDPDVMGI